MSELSQPPAVSAKNSKRWTTTEQTAFLESKIPEFLKAQSEGRLPLFWPVLDKEWFAQWSERERLYPTSSDDESAAPLSPGALLDLQNAISSRKEVSFYLFFLSFFV